MGQVSCVHIVIVGAGMAGSKLAFDLMQQKNANYSITLIGEEAQVGYNRIMLSSLLAKDISDHEMSLVDTEKMQQEGVSIIAGDGVESIDLETKVVCLVSAKTIRYDKLIMATGSRARILPIDGAKASNVMGFRTWNDVNIMASLQKKQSVCVIGGGLLGLEAAVGLVKRGHKVTVFHRSKWLLNRQLDAESAALLRSRLEQMGIEFRLGESPSSFIQSESGLVNQVMCADGERMTADLVVMAAGISPEIALAKLAGLKTNQAIVVDEKMQTSYRDVFALGECCEFDQQTFGLVAPIWDQIKVLISVLNDKDARFSIEPTPTKLKVSGVNLFSVGKVQADLDDSCIFFKDIEANHYRKLIVNDGVLVGAILYGNVADGSWYFQLIQNKTNVSDMLELLVFGEAYCCPKVA
ncbi:NAD(P)/FAD-dependent oxidoreductase [Marinomonas ushuaiensis]|uniref:NAD(P)/FAD-dependent oxidoreductase n=1 Tax=Marinomonas ushuaiensis TaxID=263818 RepID=UPI0004AEBB90|nr:FAD-dependent oxidoreductase [Marinomonas ushuaiensis]